MSPDGNYNLGANPFTNGTWHHLAATMNFATKEAIIYVDGSPLTYTYEGVSGNWTSVSDADDLLFGGNPDRATRFFNGMMDEIRIADVARSQSWIQTEVNNQSAPGSFYSLGVVEAREDQLTDISEDDLTSAGDSVATILASSGADRITDVDSGAVEGIAVVSVDDSNGQWQYDANADGSWLAFGAVADNSAVLLNTSALIRFVPNSDYNGSAGIFTFHAWDQTSGSNGATGVDVSTNGGSTAFSTEEFDATLNVTAVNDAPTVTNLGGDTLNYTEGDGAQVIDQSTIAVVSDVDSSDFDGGTLSVSFSSGSDSAEDVLSINNQGNGAGQIGVSGSAVSYGGTQIGTFSGGSSGSALVITLDSDADTTAVSALINNITYENTDTDNPTEGSRTVRFVLTDGDGGTSANYDATVTVTAADPIANADSTYLVFDGGDFVQVADDASLQMTNNLTMEAWINHSGNGTGSQIILNKEGEYEVGITADTGEIKFAIADGTSWSWHETGYFVTANEWTHVAVTYDATAGEAKTYINGELVDTYSQSSAVGDVYSGMNDLYIGGRENASTQRFEGSIDDVRVWNTTRTESEIQDNLSDTLTGSESGLVGYWVLNEAEGTTVADKTANGNDGTLGGSEGAAATPTFGVYHTNQDTLLDVSAIDGVLSNDLVDTGANASVTTTGHVLEI